MARGTGPKLCSHCGQQVSTTRIGHHKGAPRPAYTHYQQGVRCPGSGTATLTAARVEAASQ